MKTIINLVILLFQIVTALIVLFAIYMLFALLDNEWGIDGLFGFVIIQPIMGVILSILTIFLCMLIGLPIRLNKRVNNWWINHFYIAIIGLLIGLALLVMAFIPSFMTTVSVDINAELSITKQIPNMTLSCIGWLLTAFSLLHLYPPKLWMEKTE